MILHLIYGPIVLVLLLALAVLSMRHRKCVDHERKCSAGSSELTRKLIAQGDGIGAELAAAKAENKKLRAFVESVWDGAMDCCMECDGIKCCPRPPDGCTKPDCCRLPLVGATLGPFTITG